MNKKVLPLLLILFNFINLFGQNKGLIDSIKNKLNSDFFQTIAFGDSIIQNVSLSKSDEAIVKYYQALAFQTNNNHKEALKNFNIVLPELKKLSEKDHFISAILGQSNSNVYLKKYNLATTQALKARQFAEENNLTDLVASSNTALSFIYYSTGDYLEALNYLGGSEKIFIKEKKSRELSAIYNNMAILYKTMGNFNEAVVFNKKSLQISIDEKHYLGIGKSYNNIGRLFTSRVKYDEALVYFQKAVTVYNANHISNSNPFTNIGEVLFIQKKYALSEKYFNKALAIELVNKNENKLKNIYNELLKIAIKTESYKKAFDFQQKIEKINKIITKQDNEEQIEMIENQHLLVQKKHELAIAKKQSKNQSILFVVVTILFLFFGLFIFQRNKNTKLKSEKEKLILEQRVLRSQMNPHFIFNALSAIQNSLLDNEPIKSASYLSRFAKLIRQNFDFINEKKILLSDEIDALKNYLDTQQMRFQNKFNYEINIFANIDINIISVPPLLLQPFVENSIEHGFKNKKEKGEITINIFKKNEHICFEIIDNGNGIKKTTKTNKVHAIDIFKQRLKLLENNDEKTFVMKSENNKTKISFCLTL